MTVIVRPPNAPQSMRLNQSLSLGHALTPPTIDADAVFGPPRFTPEQQAANPDQPMTRVVKDVLRVGKWNIGGPQNPVMMDFTPQTLAALANSVAAQQATGHAINLGLSHGGDNLVVPTEELITPIDAVRVSGDCLWMSAYVTPEQAVTLSNPAFKTSPGIMWDYFDGSGQKHPIALIHAAVTDRPVVAGQGKFLALANAAPQGPLSKGQAMDFAAVLAFINSLLGMLGAPPLPDDTNETNIVERGGFVLKMLGGGDAPEPGDGAETPEGAMPPIEGGGAGMNNGRRSLASRLRKGTDIGAMLELAVRQAVEPLERKVAALSNSLRSGSASQAQAAFEARCTELGKAGVSAAILEGKRELAQIAGWDVRLLDGLQPAVTMSNTSRKGAVPTPPDHAVDSTPTKEEIAQRLQARGVDPKFIPGTK